MEGKGSDRYKGNRAKQLKKIRRRNPDVIMEIKSQATANPQAEKSGEDKDNDEKTEKYREKVQEILNENPKNS